MLQDDPRYRKLAPSFTKRWGFLFFSTNYFNNKQTVVSFETLIECIPKVMSITLFKVKNFEFELWHPISKLKSQQQNPNEATLYHIAPLLFVD